MKIFSTLTFIAKYILIGLGIAALLVLLMPNRFGLKLNDGNTQIEKSNNTVKPTAAEIIAKAKPAVVTLQVQSKAYPINSRQCFEGVRNYNNQQNACRFYNNGSGVLIDADGHLVTSAHVVTFSLRGQVFDQAETILVEFSDSQKTTAQIIGLDLDSDIALLKINAKTNRYLPLADSNLTQVGDSVFAIGTPYMGFNQTVTSGIVSAKFFAKVSNYLQIDAQLSSGNSGGALINDAGKLVGITQLSTQEVSGEKTLQNFAIGSSDVASIVAQLKENGKIDRGWLGLNGEVVLNLDSVIQKSQLSDEAKNKLAQDIEQIPFGLGIIVTGINPSGPAELAGLQTLDVVTQVNGKPIYSSSDLLSAIWNKKPDEKVKVTYWRNGQESQTEVVLGTKG